MNGGFFYDHGLHIFSFSEKNSFNNIEVVNEKLRSEYDKIFESLLSFGQDIFGNQFCFDLQKKEIVFFNIETGARESLAKDFIGWLTVLFRELDYFTGRNIAKEWKRDRQFEYNERLCPKVPFVTGGKYSIDNLYSSPFPQYIEVNSSIAKQIINLPDGTKIKIKVKK